MLKLGKHDHILAAYAEAASGPGWSNRPIWVVVRSREDGRIRQECIQPEEQTPEMHLLYGVSQAAHYALTGAVRSAIQKPDRNP